MSACGPRVLLLGPQAWALAPRLEVSGYQPERGSPAPSPGAAAAPAPPAAVILSPGLEERIGPLRVNWPGVPLLLGLEQDDIESRSRCLGSGADDFWLTSLGASDLLTRLRLHLGLVARTPHAEERLQVGDLCLMPRSGEVRRGGRRLDLTAREYALLLLLLRHRDTVLGREHILREVWHDQGTAASNVIEVYVRYLRQKLEKGGEPRLLHTVRGSGYCLSERLPRRESPVR